MNVERRRSATVGHLSDLVEVAASVADGDASPALLLERAVAALSGRAGVLLAGDETFRTGDLEPGSAQDTALRRQIEQGEGDPRDPGDRAVAVSAIDAVRMGVELSGSAGASPEQQVLLEGTTRLVALGLRARSLVRTERALRARSEQQVRVSQELLATLQGQRSLLEQLARIQRAISSRQPLQDVLDAIVDGTAELLGEDIAGLRLLDQTDPDRIVLVSSVGVPAGVVAEHRWQPLALGVGGQAVAQNQLVLVADYGKQARSLPGFRDAGVRAAMAAPVRRGGVAIGSLTVATRRPGRTYSVEEQEALMAFADHVGLALNDAEAVGQLQATVEQATYASLHDSLTGLPNRALFLERLAAATGGGARAVPVSVLFLDLDDFKLVNDGLGHLVGDELLSAVARRIEACTRGVDTVARLGGDEFAILLQATGESSATRTAERILGALAEPFELSGQRVHVGASVGLVSATGGDLTALELLRDADVAMYRAKAGGKQRFVVFHSQMRDSLQAASQLKIDLRDAVAQGQLAVRYQPVVDAGTGQVVSTEALVRWQHPTRGLLGPDHFVAAAEQIGLIAQIGALVLQQACRQTARWRELPGLSGIDVSVNLSARQLQEPELFDTVHDALVAAGLPPSALVLEITESLLVDDAWPLLQRLSRLRALGVRLAVDDFGTGYSALSYLGRLPFDLLKVDRSFVAGVAEGGSAGRLVGAVLAMADALGLQSVAEGVETPEQEQALLRLGCARLQGSLYAPVLEAGLVPEVAAGLLRRGARSGAV